MAPSFWGILHIRFMVVLIELDGNGSPHETWIGTHCCGLLTINTLWLLWAHATKDQASNHNSGAHWWYINTSTYYCKGVVHSYKGIIPEGPIIWIRKNNQMESKIICEARPLTRSTKSGQQFHFHFINYNRQSFSWSYFGPVCGCHWLYW